VAENVYLRALREQYEALKRNIEGLQTRAAEGRRDLTNDELRSVIEQGEKAKALFTQIEDLSEIELRNAKVAQMNAAVSAAVTSSFGGPSDAPSDAPSDGGGGFVPVGGASTQDRDPGYYVRGGQYSFIGDQFRASRMGDREAAQRLTQHTNALKDTQHMRDVLGTTTGGGAGLVAPIWLAEQFAPILHRRLRVASQLRQIPWAGPFPWTIPVAGTPALITNTSEGVNNPESDPTYTTITVLPATISGYSEVSRQMLEGSNPAVDTIIWGDMIGNFYDDAENLCVVAIEGAAGINVVTVTGTGIDLMRGGILDGIAAVEDNGGGDADLFFGRRARWHTYLKLADTSNRPLILNQRYGLNNAIGRGDAVGGFRNAIVGDMEALDVVTSPTVNASRGYVVNSQELLFSISPPVQFTFEQPAGPALIRVGVWGYAVTVANRRPKAISRVAYLSN
jgi:hypothetical protein